MSGRNRSGGSPQQGQGFISGASLGRPVEQSVQGVGEVRQDSRVTRREGCRPPSGVDGLLQTRQLPSVIELHEQGIYEIRHVDRVGIVAARGNDISEHPDALIKHPHGVVPLEDSHQRDGQRCAALPVAILITGRHSRDSAPQGPDRLRQCLRVCGLLVAGDQAGPQRVLELAIQVIARVRGRKYGPDLLDSLFQTWQAATSVTGRRTIALKYDERITKIFRDRKVKDTEPVSPSVAIPLLRAAYDESRPELQDLWARLIAAAMDPKRSDGMRLSFIDLVKRFDPLDALVLKAICDRRGEQSRPVLDFLANHLNRSPAEIELSTQNLGALNCLTHEGRRIFQVSTYGSELMRICSG